jgi:hypothetical protein
MEFDHFDLSMKDLSTQNVITMCNSSRPLYNMLLPSCSSPSSSAAAPTTLVASASTWQRRLGHSGVDTLSKLYKASPTSVTPRTVPMTSTVPHDSIRATRDIDIHDSSRVTRGTSVLALPTALPMSPSSYAGATDTTSTSAVAVREGRTGGTSGQPSSDDHAGEVGLPTTG